MIKKILLVIGIGLVILLLGVFMAAHLWQTPGEERTPNGLQRNTSYYIDMPDGARIAADLWVPPNLAIGQRVPTVIEGTRYWREMGLTMLGRVAAFLGVGLPGVAPSNYDFFFPEHGYAMLTIDVRGTGASSGVHTTEYSLEEKDDYRHIIEWVTTQPWSSGDVFAMGVSYSGTSAELMTTSQHPALKAIAPLYSDFDAQMQLVTPGGVYQPAFTEAWSDLVGAMDENELCGVITASNTSPEPADCDGPALLISGVKPVSGEEDFLAAAVASHASPVVKDMVTHLVYRDSTWGSTEVQPNENLVFGLKNAIEASAVPMFVVTGWFDAATTNGALARYATFSNLQEVWVGAFSHGGGEDTDPFKESSAASMWSQDQQLQNVLAFFERYRSDQASDAMQTSMLNYYVNGAGVFRQSEVWPPSHLESKKFYLGSDKALVTALQNSRGFDRYEVNTKSATATTTRWATQLAGSDVIYDRRAEMTEHVLSYSTSAFEQDTELTGSVVLDLWMTSNQPQGALHAYLEDVAPDGAVTYLTEGVLNLMHRQNEKNPTYPMFGPSHSYLQKDARSMPTKQLVSFSTTLYATSALIRQGHKLRLSLAGGDATSFAPLPADGPPPKWHIYMGPTSPSSVTVSLAAW
ncbi:MAG: putative acyl esterase [Limisphaerales bacterium]|jgi:predicted acyl esterase